MSIFLKRILAPIDFSEASKLALDYSALLAWDFDVKLSILHVVEPPVMPIYGTSPVIVREDLMRKHAEESINALCLERLPDPNLVERILTDIGAPHLCIVENAKRIDADLIVLATHGYTGLRHLLMGSVAEKVVRHATCPVLTLGEKAMGKDWRKRESTQFRNIVVPTDLSQESRKAIRYAAAFARKFDAKITLVCVIPTTLAPDEQHLKLDEDYRRWGLQSRILLQRIREDEIDRGVSVDLVMAKGSPHQAVVETARKRRADLIAISTHGYTGLKHTLLGSTTERVVRHASCPVLVVREKEHEFV